jgi:hypothetical protein
MEPYAVSKAPGLPLWLRKLLVVLLAWLLDELRGGGVDGGGIG